MSLEVSLQFWTLTHTRQNSCSKLDFPNNDNNLQGAPFLGSMLVPGRAPKGPRADTQVLSCRVQSLGPEIWFRALVASLLLQPQVRVTAVGMMQGAHVPSARGFTLKQGLAATADMAPEGIILVSG